MQNYINKDESGDRLVRNEDERKAFMRVYEKYAGLRLTARGENGFSYFPECFNEPCLGTDCRRDDCEFIRVVCERLCRIEENSFRDFYVSHEKRGSVRCNRSNVMVSKMMVETNSEFKYFCVVQCSDCRKHLLEMIRKGEG